MTLHKRKKRQPTAMGLGRNGGEPMVSHKEPLGMIFLKTGFFFTPPHMTPDWH